MSDHCGTTRIHARACVRTCAHPRVWKCFDPFKCVSQRVNMQHISGSMRQLPEMMIKNKKEKTKTHLVVSKWDRFGQTWPKKENVISVPCLWEKGGGGGICIWRAASGCVISKPGRRQIQATDLVSYLICEAYEKMCRTKYFTISK